jgi:hypothetical protein
METYKAIPQARKAEKHQVKLKLGIQGPSGSGKTLGALELAHNLWPDAKILVIDTENDSASLYADKVAFDTIPLDPPYESVRYEACIDYAVKNGYDVAILDSVTHQWDGEGGILRRKEELDQRPNANSWANWSKFTPEHTHFIETIKQAPIHIIATLRSKQDYVLQTNDKGKSTPTKLGLAPIQREGFEYEFTLVFDVQMDHKATVSKNRTGLFGSKVLDLTDKKVANQIREWLESGKPVESPVQPAAPPAPHTNGKTTPQKVDDWKLESDQLRCHVYDAQKRTSKQGEFVAVKHNGQVNGKDIAFCFHPQLFDALLLAKGGSASFLIEAGDFVKINDVIQVADQLYMDGKPALLPPPTNLHGVDVTDADIPF